MAKAAGEEIIKEICITNFMCKRSLRQAERASFLHSAAEMGGLKH